MVAARLASLLSVVALYMFGGISFALLQQHGNTLGLAPPASLLGVLPTYLGAGLVFFVPGAKTRSFFELVNAMQPVNLVIAALSVASTSLAIAGLAHVGSGLATVLQASKVVWTALFSTAFLARRLRRSQWLAVLLVFLGLAVGSRRSASASQHSSSSAAAASLGAAFCVLHAMCAATEMIVVERYMRQAAAALAAKKGDANAAAAAAASALVSGAAAESDASRSASALLAPAAAAAAVAPSPSVARVASPRVTRVHIDSAGAVSGDADDASGAQSAPAAALGKDSFEMGAAARKSRAVWRSSSTPLTSVELCVINGVIGLLLLGVWMVAYTIPNMNELVLARASASPRQALGVYAAMTLASACLTVGHFMLIERISAVGVGVLMPLRAVVVFIISGVLYCDTQPHQCFSPQKSVAAAAIVGGVAMFNLV